MSVWDEVLRPDRLTAVRDTGLLDTAPEEAFDRYSRLASLLLGTPFAFVTVVDDTRSFWKSRIGVDPEDPLARQNTVDQSFCQYVVASGGPLIVPDTLVDALTRDNPSNESMGVRAWAGYPVHSPGGQVIGTFCVVDTVPREWTEREVTVLETLSQAVSGEIGLRAALAEARSASLELAVRSEQMSALVAVLQESLVPIPLPAVPGLDVADRYLHGGPGVAVSGDFYDVFPVPHGWAVVIGDVAGEGVTAARTSSLARHTFRAAAQLQPAPEEVLRAVARAVSDTTDAASGAAPAERALLSAVYLRLRPTDNGGWDAILAAAGHPLPLVLRADGSADRIPAAGPRLGHVGEPSFTNVPLSLLPGDAVVLHTTGTDGPEPAGPGAASLIEALAGLAGHDAAAICDGLLAAWGPSPGVRDEGLAVVVVRVPPAPGR